MRVLVLGVSGMLGSTLYRYLHVQPNLEVYGSCRSASTLRHFSSEQAANIFHSMAVIDDQDALNHLLAKTKPDVIINCIGLIKQLDNAQSVLAALPINSLFPHRLQLMADLMSARVIHFSTDCVFSGTKGNYVESDFCDAEDIYGKSKALGELVDYDNALTLRTSIIGHELQSNLSLIDWFLSQEEAVKGYKQAIFSGLPTIEVAEVIYNNVLPNDSLKGLYHLSVEPINKYDLLMLVKNQYSKNIDIEPYDDFVIDRSLNSNRFRKDASYVPPSWSVLVEKMHKHKGL